MAKRRIALGDDAGHSSKEVGIVHELVTDTDKFRDFYSITYYINLILVP